MRAALFTFDPTVVVDSLRAELFPRFDPKQTALVTDAAALRRDFLDDKSMYQHPRALPNPAGQPTFYAPVPHENTALPIAAVTPGCVEAVAAVVRVCYRHRCPLVVRGGATGLEGGCVPLYGGVVLDTSNLVTTRVDAENGVAWVGAGVRKLHLAKHLGPLGLLFGPDPASNPTIGGMVSTSGSGMTTIRYGTTRENVVSLVVVTAAGEIIRTRQPVRKASTGLDLTNLFIGSEGTLGVVVEACLKIHRLPIHRTGAMVTFPSLHDAVRAVVAMRKAQGARGTGQLVRCELINGEGIAAGNKEFRTQLTPVPTVLLEFQGDVVDSLTDEFRTAERVFREHSCQHINYVERGAELDTVWEARRGCYMAARKARGKGTAAATIEPVYISDVCVPMTTLADCVKQTEEDFRKEGVPCIICAHIADGNFHAMVPFATAKERQQTLELDARLIARAVRMGGACSGEHGIGLGKVKHLLQEHGQAHLALQRGIKAAMDPRGIMNPGKFYPPAPLTLGGSPAPPLAASPPAAHL